MTGEAFDAALERARAEGRLQCVPIEHRCGHIAWWSLILDEEPLEAVVADLEGWECLCCREEELPDA